MLITTTSSLYKSEIWIPLNAADLSNLPQPFLVAHAQHPGVGWGHIAHTTHGSILRAKIKNKTTTTKTENYSFHL